jgi:outer membrane murein-binding lipoprotein Lpp
MKFSFKSCAAALLVVAGIAGCSPSAPPSEENDLVLSPAEIEINGAADKAYSQIKLVCGCPFNLQVESFAGDTNQISWKIDRLGQQVYQFEAEAAAKPGVTAGTYTAKLALMGGQSNFRDTLTIKLIVP